MTPFEQAVEAAAKAAYEANLWGGTWESSSRETKASFREKIHAALPHLRRMHFQEAAELVEKRNEYLEAEEAGLGSPTAEYKAWKEAASFLRGVQ